MVKKISSEEFETMDKSGVAVVDFSAEWCGPCRMLAPVLQELSEELEGQVRFYNVDVDENHDLAARYKITNIPALLILKDGEKQDIQVGFQPKQNLKAAFKRFLI